MLDGGCQSRDSFSYHFPPSNGTKRERESKLDNHSAAVQEVVEILVSSPILNFANVTCSVITAQVTQHCALPWRVLVPLRPYEGAKGLSVQPWLS